MIDSKIAIGIATNGRRVELAWAKSIAKIFRTAPISSDFIVVNNAPDATDSNPKRIAKIAANRQQIAEQAVEDGFEYLFFLDDDIVCPAETLQLLHNQFTDPQVMVCGGICPAKEEYPTPLVFKEFDTGGPFFGWKKGDVFPCKALGTGCMMIRTKIFESLNKPWFKFDDEHKQGEDVYFCRKVNEAGFIILAHAGVLPDHISPDGHIFNLPDLSNPKIGFGRAFRL